MTTTRITTMDQRSFRDGEAMFDVTFDAAQQRIADLHGTAVAGRTSPATAAPPPPRPGLRYALGLRLLQLGATLVRDEPLVRGRG